MLYFSAGHLIRQLHDLFVCRHFNLPLNMLSLLLNMNHDSCLTLQ